MNIVLTVLLSLVGLINFAPLVGVSSRTMVASMYGVAVTTGDMAILLRHRAALFGVVGGFILFAAYAPAYRTVAIVGGLASMLSFVALAATTEHGAPIRKVVLVDYVGIALLLIATALHISRGATST